VALIRIEDLRKVYQMGETEVQALRGVSLTVEHGEYVAIMGASGSGKSTLMQLIGCLDTPTSGHYWFDGTEVSQLSDDEMSALRNHKIAFVFQSFNLIPQLTVMENVELPLTYRDMERHAREDRAEVVLDALGLWHRREHHPNELSGGECQRVAIARALATEPQLVLADEPTGNLDTRTGEEVMEILDRLSDDGTTIVMVTHDPGKARRAGRLIQMQDGMIQRELVGVDKDRMMAQFESITHFAPSP
jgi:putative ABC transport system ATP-binding protein